MGAAAPPGAPLPAHIIMAYHDSWRERAGATAADTTLANTPAYVDVLALAFVKPDLSYRGDLDLSGTGLDYRIDGRTVRDAIALLKHRHPATRVLISVGGGAYRAWEGLDAQAVGRLVRDLGADGVDVDYETDDPGCTRGGDGRIGCRVGPTYIAYLHRLRAVLPRPYVLAAAAVSVGAYGEGSYRDAQPTGGPYIGSMLGLLRDPAARLVDLISIQAYDAGERFDPVAAFNAYRLWWKGPLLVGTEVRLKGGDGPFYSAPGAEGLARTLARDPRGGIMVYPMLEQPYGATASLANPDGAMLLRAACAGLGRTGCR